MTTNPDRRFGVWQSGLTGRYYAGNAKRVAGTTPEDDRWEACGVKYDVTDDIQRIVDANVRNDRDKRTASQPGA